MTNSGARWVRGGQMAVRMWATRMRHAFAVGCALMAGRGSVHRKADSLGTAVAGCFQRVSVCLDAHRAACSSGLRRSAAQDTRLDRIVDTFLVKIENKTTVKE